MLAWRPLARRLQPQSVGSQVAYASREAHVASELQRKYPHHSVARLLADNKPKQVCVDGWVRSVRKQKRIAFAVVGDGSTTRTVQAILSPEQASGLSYGTAVSMYGAWQPSTGAGQAYELRISKVLPSKSAVQTERTDSTQSTRDSALLEELDAEGDSSHHVKIRGHNDSERNPVQPKYQTPEYLRTVPHLRARTQQNAFLLRLRSRVIASLTRHFEREEFIQVHTPVITSSDCEGAGEVFTAAPATPASPDPGQAIATPEPTSSPQHISSKVQHFFRDPKYLTVSAQLHLEALAHAVSKVWTLSPTFRAERSDTPRHLSEFYMLEAEMCFEDDCGVMDHIEKMLASIAADLLGDAEATDDRFKGVNWIANELDDLVADARSGSEWPSATARDTVILRCRGLLAVRPWPRVTYADAIEICQKAAADGAVTFAVSPTYDGGLDAEHERYLTQHFNPPEWPADEIEEWNPDEGGHRDLYDFSKPRPPTPVFVTNYPANQKPFYMAPTLPGDPAYDAKRPTVANFDLLVPSHLELAGGSMREHRLEELQAAMRARGLRPDSPGLAWYEDLRRYGSAPHGGFGMGFDRLLGYLSGVDNVRDVVPWPRWVGRCDG